MRSRFDMQLTQLNESLIEMGSMVQYAIAKATKALEDHDVPLAQSVINGDDVVDAKEKEIEGLCLKILLQQQPVAKDLRQVSTALKMITDMERIGDQAADISELCLELAGQEYIKKLEHIPMMAQATVKMVSDSIEAFTKKDRELAQAVIDADDVVDELYLTIKKDLVALVHQDVQKGEQAFDLMQIAKYYERIGDHAVNIAEWVIFSITGMHKNVQVL